MAFGSSEASAQVSFENIDKKVKTAYPNIPVRWAYTSHIIRTKLGWHQKNVPGPTDGTVAMGIKAARKALYYSNLAANEIDLVIWSGEEIKEYRNWPVGPKIQKELGLAKAWSFDMQQRCGTTLVALKLARDMIRADRRIQNILIASGYRNSDLIHYPNPRVRWMYYLAAGGAASIGYS